MLGPRSGLAFQEGPRIQFEDEEDVRAAEKGLTKQISRCNLINGSRAGGRYAKDNLMGAGPGLVDLQCFPALFHPKTKQTASQRLA